MFDERDLRKSAQNIRPSIAALAVEMEATLRGKGFEGDEILSLRYLTVLANMGLQNVKFAIEHSTKENLKANVRRSAVGVAIRALQLVEKTGGLDEALKAIDAVQPKAPEVKVEFLDIESDGFLRDLARRGGSVRINPFAPMFSSPLVPRDNIFFGDSSFNRARDFVKLKLDPPKPVEGITRKGGSQYFNSSSRGINNLFLTNSPSLSFRDISSEQYREYVDTIDGEAEVVLRIEAPIALAVGEHGHRIIDSNGVAHYIDHNLYTSIRWKPRAGQPVVSF